MATSARRAHVPGPVWPGGRACDRAGWGTGRTRDDDPAEGRNRRHHHPPGGRTCPGQHWPGVRARGRSRRRNGVRAGSRRRTGAWRTWRTGWAAARRSLRPGRSRRSKPGGGPEDQRRHAGWRSTATNGRSKRRRLGESSVPPLLNHVVAKGLNNPAIPTIRGSSTEVEHLVVNQIYTLLCHQ